MRILSVWLKLSLIWGVLLGIGACAFPENDTSPLVVAHRATPSLWPENSRSAIIGSLQRGYPAIEVDIVLTKDHVPVISHDPWLDPKYCTDAAGAALTQRVYIQDLSLESLQTDYLCGGIPDPDFPDAEVFPDTSVSLEEMIELLRPHPHVRVQLDIKYEPGLTPGPEDFAQAVLSRWVGAGLENPWYLSANLPEVLMAFREWMAGEPIDTVLIYPRFPPDTSDAAIALQDAFVSSLGLKDALGLARHAEATGIAWAWELIDWHAAEAARKEGLLIMVWTVNDEDLLKKFCNWPVDVIITDYPESTPCLARY